MSGSGNDVGIDEFDPCICAKHARGSNPDCTFHVVPPSGSCSASDARAREQALEKRVRDLEDVRTALEAKLRPLEIEHAELLRALNTYQPADNGGAPVIRVINLGEERNTLKRRLDELRKALAIVHKESVYGGT